MIRFNIINKMSRMKLIIIIISLAFINPCSNIASKDGHRPREIINYYITINMYFNHSSYITRKRWNKIMKITNGNVTKSHEKGRKTKEKLYHKVVVWNKQNSNHASDKEGFPVIQRAMLKHDSNLIILTEANFSDENFANVASEFNRYNIHHKVIPSIVK